MGGATLRYSYIPRLQSETVPTLVISQEVADQLLAPAGRTVSTAQDLVRARRANPNAPASGFDVPTTVRMTVSLTPVHDVEVRVLVPEGRQARSVELIRAKRSIPFKVDGKYAVASIPTVHIAELVHWKLA